MKKPVETTTYHIGRKMTFKTDRIILRGKELVVDYIDCRLGSVAVVAVDKHGKIIIEKNRRYPVGNKTVIEIPAGHIEYGEDPSECARREIEEETGYLITSIEKVGFAYTSPGHCNEIIQIYFAKLGTRKRAKLQLGEDIKLLKMAPNDILKMIKEGRIHDMKTIAGILLCEALHLF